MLSRRCINSLNSAYHYGTYLAWDTCTFSLPIPQTLIHHHISNKRKPPLWPMRLYPQVTKTTKATSHPHTTCCPLLAQTTIPTPTWIHFPRCHLQSIPILSAWLLSFHSVAPLCHIILNSCDKPHSIGHLHHNLWHTSMRLHPAQHPLPQPLPGHLQPSLPWQYIELILNGFNSS